MPSLPTPTLPFPGPHPAASTAKKLCEAVISTGVDETFVVFDEKGLDDALQLWRVNLPKVAMHFAVKSNPHPVILKKLVAEGVGFDCATPEEINIITKLAGQKGADRIVYSMPIKNCNEILYADKKGISLTVSDTIFDLQKVTTLAPKMRRLLRLRLDDPTAEQCLGSKFGLPMDELDHFLDEMVDHKLVIHGIHFHIGTHAHSPGAFTAAIQSAEKALEKAHKLGLVGTETPIIDIGGGFAHYQAGHQLFDEMASSIRGAVDAVHKKWPQVCFIAEPGRFICENAFHIGINVMGSRYHSGLLELTLQESIYGWLSCIPLDDYRIGPQLVQKCQITDSKHNDMVLEWHYSPDDALPDSVLMREENQGPDGKIAKTVCWGCTCDSLDCIFVIENMPRVVPGRDWLVFPSVGAYSFAISSSFNGIWRKYCPVYKAKV